MPDQIKWGSLTRLRDRTVGTHLTMCESDLVDNFILSTLRKTAKIGVYDVFEVASKAQVDAAISDTTVLPLNGDKWLLDIDVSKVRNHLSYLAENLIFGDTNIAWFRTSSYRDFKAVNEALKVDNIKWVTWLTSAEMNLMLGNTPMDDKTRNFFLKNYSRDIDAPLRLRREVERGRELSRPSDIQQLIGVSAGTLEGLVFKMLNLGVSTTTDQGLKTQERVILRSFQMLSEKMGYARLKSQLFYIARDLYAVKMLYLSGEIYDYIPESNPGPYSDLHLKKYTRKLDTIKELPLSRFQHLYLELKSARSWSNSMDMLDFLYTWFALTVTSKVA